MGGFAIWLWHMPISIPSPDVSIQQQYTSYMNRNTTLLPIGWQTFTAHTFALTKHLYHWIINFFCCCLRLIGLAFMLLIFLCRYVRQTRSHTLYVLREMKLHSIRMLTMNAFNCPFADKQWIEAIWFDLVAFAL